MFFVGQQLKKTLQLALAISLAAGFLDSSRVWADGVTANTGIVTDSIVGNNNQQNSQVGVGINGDNNGSVNNNQNSVAATANPIAYSAPQYNSGSGQGGTAAMILPRNPLTLNNASLGRSNFGLQFGVQNNPGISTLTGGKENGLGWFMQGGLTIPFGKIPSVYQGGKTAMMDTIRQDQMDRQRKVFGEANPSNRPQAEANVKGRVVGLNAYNYSTVSSGKLPLQGAAAGGGIGEIVSPQPKVLALKPAEAFNQPLHTGEKVGSVEVGKEYAYLGHTRSGWVKVLLPNGREAWTSTQFEYIKFDFTEVDGLASVPPTLPEPAVEAAAPAAPAVKTAKPAQSSAVPANAKAANVTTTKRRKS